MRKKRCVGGQIASDPPRTILRRVRRLLWFLAILAALSVALITVALIVTRLPPFGATLEGERAARAERSGHYRDGKFQNLEPTHKLQPGSFAAMLRHQVFGDEQRVPLRPVPLVRRVAADYAAPPASGLRATWIGHATVLVELDGQRILVDPIFSQRSSPFDFVGPERFTPPPIALAALPEILAVVISHDHYDHLDMATIVALAKRGAHFVVPLGIGAHLERWGVARERVRELDWNEHTELKGLRFTATPGRHYSGRGLFDTDATLWATWVIAGPQHRVFFSGDTGYSSLFRQLGARFGPFDLTLIKIGASDPTWQQIHMSPEEAVRVHSDVRGRLLLPIHWGTFNLANHAWSEPAERLLVAARAARIAFVLPKPGEWVDVAAPPPVATWWR
jgi:L-ascorbate metabolism protein UlaG (beta-lactamase superfamily)